MTPSTVFQRSALGQQASRDPNAPIPRTLRTLLMSIDGKTDVATYERFLSSFGDVTVLLDALLSAGYIEAVAPVAPAPATTPAARAETAETTTGRSSWFGARTRSPMEAAATSRMDTQPVADSRFMPTAQTRPAPAPAPTPAARSAFGGGARSPQAMGAPSSLLSDMGGPSYDPYRPLPSNRLAGSNASINEQARVKQAKALMTEFLFAYLPDAALEASLAIDRLETTEQVLANLGGYERMVAKAGRAAAAHIAAVRDTLNQ